VSKKNEPKNSKKAPKSKKNYRLRDLEVDKDSAKNVKGGAEPKEI
jgi:hypothetical protein